MAINSDQAQLVATMLETVRPKLSYFLVQEESKFMQQFKKAAEKHQISPWNVNSGQVQGWRIPILLSIGGDYQAFNLDGGDAGTGSLQKTAYMTLGYFSSNIAYNISSLAVFGTKTNKQAVSNALEFSLGNAIKETALYNEIGFFQDGTGVLAQATSVVGGAGAVAAGATVTYQLETAAFTYIRLRGFNALVDVANGSNVILAAGCRISNINFALNQVSILVGVAGYTTTNTDQIVFPNMAAVTATISSGSWRYGLYTFNTTNTTGSLLGLSYSSAYELACPQVNANGGFFTPSLLLSGQNQLIQRRDDKAFARTIGVCHMAQSASWYLEGVTISNWGRGTMQDSGGKMPDLVPKGNGKAYGQTFMAGDVEHYISRYANKSRVDWLSPQNFGIVNLAEITFLQTPEGQRTFIGHSTTTGNPLAGFQFYVVNTNNFYSVDPGCSVVYYGLTIPSGQ